MYQLSDEQITFIENDIKKRGVDMEELQGDLLDHICCVVEREMEEGKDFEACYAGVIKKFYNKELKEIEAETIQLLNFKNYYEMRKLMMLSGLFTAIAFIIGSVFKIMYWPGAGPLLISAIAVFSLVFLPLLFILKTREAGNQRDKIVLGIGIFTGVLYCLSSVFLLHHWPGYRLLWFVTLGISFFVLVPVYFFSGIRKPETRVNTIVATVLLLGVLGIQFTMTSLRPSSQTMGRIYTYLQSEELLQKMRSTNTTGSAADVQMADAIQATCQEIKQLILQTQLKQKSIEANFEPKEIAGNEKYAGLGFFATGRPHELLTQLQKQVTDYNQNKTEAQKIPIQNTILDTELSKRDFFSSLYVLNNLTQIQIYLAGMRLTVAMK